MKHTKETKEKISRKLQGRTFTEEHKNKISESSKGKKLSQSSKDKISKANKGRTAWNKGKKCDWVTKRNLENNPMKNRFAEKHPNWKGGKIIVGGYVYLYNIKLGRHFGGKYIKRANLVWYEKTGELIKIPYEIHHINGEKQDDKFENLVKLKKSVHSHHHLINKYNKMVRDEKGKFQKKQNGD